MLPTLLHYIGVLLLASSCIADPDYSEQLVLQPLAPASVLASFNFRSNASQASYNEQNFQYFPRSLGQILQHARAKELHLRFSSGRWDAESWGNRPWNGVKEGGTGVETWTWIEAESEEEALKQWNTLNNALAGLFCASMNFIDSTRTSQPFSTFEPLGDHNTSSSLHLFHGALTREVVCTENLTPFLKLLPCKGRVGIASLLDGHKLFDATWQTMSIDVRPVCSVEKSGCVMEIEQTIDMVLDIDRSKRPRDDPIPRPLPDDKLVCDQSRQYPDGDSCYPLDLSATQDLSLKDLFGKPIQGSCLSPSDSAFPVCVAASKSLELYTTNAQLEFRPVSDKLRCLTLPEKGEFELLIPKQDPSHFLPVSTPPIFVERSITGHGQERGGIRILLKNPNPTQNVSFIYFEALPWFMKAYMHTLKTSIPDTIDEMYYRPGLDRKRGSHLELAMTVPAGQTLELSYDFEKAILRYTEYPPDANRGRDVAPAVIRVLNTSPGAIGDAGPAYLRTTPLMLPLPTPDFSMPYNVIILTSTVIALAFGTIYNMLIRQFVGEDEATAGGLKGRIMAALAFIRSKIMGVSQSTTPAEKEKKDI